LYKYIMRECRSGQTGRTQNKNHVLKLPQGGWDAKLKVLWMAKH